MLFAASCLGQVPNTTTFSLQDVVVEVNPTTADLQDCFNDATDSYFNSSYSGSKNSLLNFRDYGSHNNPPDLSNPYLVWELDAISNGITQDATPNNNDGSSNSGGWTTTSAGVINYASIPILESSGLNAPVDATNENEISVSVWWYGNASNLTGGTGIIWKAVPQSNLGLTLLVAEDPVSTGYNMIKVIDGTNGFYSYTVPSSTFHFADYTWVHIVVTRTLTSLKVYANGIQIHSVNRSFNSIPNRLFTLGSSSSAAIGRFDQLAIWYRELDYSSIYYLNNLNNGRRYINW